MANQQFEKPHFLLWLSRHSYRGMIPRTSQLGNSSSSIQILDEYHRHHGRKCSSLGCRRGAIPRHVELQFGNYFHWLECCEVRVVASLLHHVSSVAPVDFRPFDLVEPPDGIIQGRVCFQVVHHCTAGYEAIDHLREI